MRKVFVISLHHCATQSTNLFLRNAGLRTCHWPGIVNGVNYEKQIVGWETQPDKIVEILHPVFGGFDAFSDVPLPVLYQELDAVYPESKFIAVFRNPVDWVRSVRRHCGIRPLNPFERAQYWRYLEAKPTHLGSLPNDCLVRMYLRHYEELIAYFNGRKNLLLVNLSDPEIGDKLAAFIRVEPQQFPRFDRYTGSHR
jgi:hypothetical protein